MSKNSRLMFLQSLCRKALDLDNAEKYTPFDCGHSAYRFLVPKDEVMADPVCREFVEQEGMLCMIVGEDRRVVVYPCVENKLMNFLLVRTATEHSRASTDFVRHTDPPKQRIALRRCWLESAR